MKKFYNVLKNATKIEKGEKDNILKVTFKSGSKLQKSVVIDGVTYQIVTILKNSQHIKDGFIWSNYARLEGYCLKNANELKIMPNYEDMVSCLDKLNTQLNEGGRPMLKSEDIALVKGFVRDSLPKNISTIFEGYTNTTLKNSDIIANALKDAYNCKMIKGDIVTNGEVDTIEYSVGSVTNVRKFLMSIEVQIRKTDKVQKVATKDTKKAKK